MSRGRALVAALLLLDVLGGCGVAPAPPSTPDLSRLRVVTRAGDIAGYDRSCSSRGHHGCSFGPAWTDDVTVAGGHDGCGTRDQILARDLRDVAYKPGTHRCVVVSGELDDPYSGLVVQYRRGSSPQAVQVDHIESATPTRRRVCLRWSCHR